MHHKRTQTTQATSDFQRVFEHFYIFEQSVDMNKHCQKNLNEIAKSFFLPVHTQAIEIWSEMRLDLKLFKELQIWWQLAWTTRR